MLKRFGAGKARYVWLMLLLGMGSVHVYALVPLPHEEGLSLVVDYLFWKIEEDGLIFASIIKEGSIFPLTGPLVNVEQKFNWESGVRLGAGYAWHNEWNLWASWTHLKECACSSVHNDDFRVGVVPFSLIFSLVGTDAQSFFRFQFETVDIDTGRAYQ